MASSADWASAIASTVRQVAGATIHRLPGWTVIEPDEIEEAVAETGMIRILGLGEPLDFFRKPNEFELEEFDGVAARAKKNGDGTFLPDPLDLIQTKLNIERSSDQQDSFFLESLFRADYRKRLPTATFAVAKEMLDRYSEWQVLQAAMENPDEVVRALATEHLHEFAEAGDPFSQAILAGREIL
jgi:hypothetical protein